MSSIFKTLFAKSIKITVVSSLLILSTCFQKCKDNIHILVGVKSQMWQTCYYVLDKQWFVLELGGAWSPFVIIILPMFMQPDSIWIHYFKCIDGKSQLHIYLLFHRMNTAYDFIMTKCLSVIAQKSSRDFLFCLNSCTCSRIKMACPITITHLFLLINKLFTVWLYMRNYLFTMSTSA